MTHATPFLMFQGGKGQAALDFYVETVPGSRIESVERFGPDGPGPEGTIIRAHAVIAGQKTPQIQHVGKTLLPPGPCNGQFVI